MAFQTQTDIIAGSPGQDGWDWTYSDGTEIQVDSDLSQALIGIPDDAFQQHTSDFKEYGLQVLNEYVSSITTTATDFKFYHAGGLDQNLHLFYYQSQQNASPPPPPLLAPPPPDSPTPATPQSGEYIKEIGDAIASLTIGESSKLCTYLHGLGIKCVLATFGSNNNLEIDDIIGMESSESSDSTDTLQVEDVRYAPPLAKTDTRYVLPQKQAATKDEEDLWQSVYRRPVGNLDILDDLKKK